MEEIDKPIRYCLYARKSSESDERQAMSIDSQLKEMTAMASREGLLVAEVRQESHSAKMSGTRPVFTQLIVDIREGMFDGILTWAPDRLSRNAGDLGSLVDLMDLGKLQQIKTHSQSFTNNPNEKFLLMILCSQAKLENDNRGLNVKRGIRTKCEMGWRPTKPPLGYYNRAFNGVHDTIPDPERAPFIKEMFERVGNYGQSGRTIKNWFDKAGMTNTSGKLVTLSQIFLMLKNPYYYGEFEYPLNSGNWYQGSHEPLTTKAQFEKVQQQVNSPRETKWGSKGFAYRGVLFCASCGAVVSAEEKYKKLYDGSISKYVYYRCCRAQNKFCDQKYINEKDINFQLLELIQQREEELMLTDSLRHHYLQWQKATLAFLKQQYISVDDDPSLKDYAKHIIENGSVADKARLVKGIVGQLKIDNKTLII